jgi:uncharacterized coiled-coil DUF342 family protein
MELSGNEKDQALESLAQKLTELREQRRIVGKDADDRAERRDKLNEQVRTLRTEVQKLRTTRDELNEEVKKLKQQRSVAVSKIREKIEGLRAISQEKRTIAENKPSRPYQPLKKELEEVEWKVQTTSHTLQEDKEMMEQVKHLETQLSVYRKIEKFSQKASELRNQVNTLKNENEVRHQKLTTLAQRSQELHKNMLEKIEVAKTKRREADEMHKQFLEARMKVKPLQDDVVAVSAQMLQLRKGLREAEQKQKKESEDTLRQTIENQAREKLRRGEKLSWEEFQLLAEKGMTSQD